MGKTDKASTQPLLGTWWDMQRGKQGEIQARTRILDGILAVDVFCQSCGRVTRVQSLELETRQESRRRWTREARLSFTHLPRWGM